MVCLLFCALLASGGCVRRRMTVRSQPSGALVYVDDQKIGVTPVSTPFTYYGTRKIQLFKDGFEPQMVKQRFLPPWYELPVLEFISENLWPGEIRDERMVEIQLAPLQNVPNEQLFQRADALRGDAQAGNLTAMPNVVPASAPVVPADPLTQPLPYLGNGSPAR